MQTVYGIYFWFHTILQKKNTVTFWVLYNLFSSFGKCVPYMLLLKMDNLVVNNHLYLYYLIKVCKNPSIYCWQTFLFVATQNLACNSISCTSSSVFRAQLLWVYLSFHNTSAVISHSLMNVFVLAFYLTIQFPLLLIWEEDV